MKLFSIYILILFSFCAHGQDAQSLLNKVVNKMEGVTDYSANVQIIADIPLIKILPSNAKIYYKKPYKFKVVSKGIAILDYEDFTAEWEFDMESKYGLSVVLDLFFEEIRFLLKASTISDN